RLTVDEAAPGFYGMHNQVTAIDAAAGTLTTEDYHAACDVTCMHANEAFRGDMTVTEQTLIFDADGSKITMADLTAKFASGDLYINYFCNGGPGDNGIELIFVVGSVKAGMEIHKHGANCTHGHAGMQADWQPLSTITDTMTATTALNSGYYYLDKNITLADNCYLYTYSGATVYLCLNGKELRGADGKEYILTSKGTNSALNICDCVGNGTIGKDWNGKGGGFYRPAIYVEVGGNEVNLYAGSITGIKNAGSVVDVKNGSAFNMFGGQIVGNKVDSAGAVHLEAGGTFNMFGGEIKENDVPADKTQVTAADSNPNVNIVGGTVTENAPPPPAAYTHTCTHGHADWSGLTWTKLSDVVAASGNTTLPSGNYYLDQDITLSGGYITVTEANAEINLCLNGNKLNGANGQQYIIYVNANNVSLSICDSSSGQTGSIGDGWTGATGNRVYSVVRMGGANKTGCELNLYAGSISNINAASVIYININNRFNMFGGKVLNNTIYSHASSKGTVIYNNNGTLSISGGVLAGHTIGTGYNPIYSSNTNVTVTGGQFDVSPKTEYIPATHEITTDAAYGYTVVAK
ncbi:MAG: hypothetical protein IJP02_03690, partial [Oscillospiraceae bacterium]|nr:hypothetical protein [Oscillospiraceae bacterium]